MEDKYGIKDGREWYLGDGLYVSLDAGMVKLRAPRGHDDHVVYMEPEVLVAFETWLMELAQLIKERNEQWRST